VNLPSSMIAQGAAVRLGPNHGYDFDGDRVKLHAELLTLPHPPCASDSLQLWACAGEPGSETTLADLRRSGVRVARTELKLPTPIRPQAQQVETWIDAHVPPQGRAFRMLMVVADAEERILDSAAYSIRQEFVAPKFVGSVGYAINGEALTISVECIENPRSSTTRSGSLVVELWALKSAYEGGAIDGYCVGQMPVAPLDGQSWYSNLQQVEACRQPPTGQWPIALLLREWTDAHGFVTRDFRLFDRPFVVTPIAPVAKADVVTTPVNPSTAPVTTKVVTTPPAVATPPVASVQSAVAVTPAASTAPVTAKVVASPPTASTPSAAPVTAKVVASPPTAATPSVASSAAPITGKVVASPPTATTPSSAAPVTAKVVASPPVAPATVPQVGGVKATPVVAPSKPNSPPVTAGPQPSNGKKDKAKKRK